MQKCFGLFCVSLIFCATLSETIGLVIAAKEKRGWTLNSAGYLLGPQRTIEEQTVSGGNVVDKQSGKCSLCVSVYKAQPGMSGVGNGYFDHTSSNSEKMAKDGIDGHRTLGDKPGLAGKRDMGQEEDFRSSSLRIADEDIIHTVIDFLSYLRLKEIGALDSLPSSVTSEEIANP